MQPSLTIPIPEEYHFIRIAASRLGHSRLSCNRWQRRLVKPIESGIYEVNDPWVHDLEYPVMGEHASNLGGLIARDIVREA